MNEEDSLKDERAFDQDAANLANRLVSDRLKVKPHIKITEITPEKRRMSDIRRVGDFPLSEEQQKHLRGMFQPRSYQEALVKQIQEKLRVPESLLVPSQSCTATEILAVMEARRHGIRVSVDVISRRLGLTLMPKLSALYLQNKTWVKFVKNRERRRQQKRLKAARRRCGYRRK